jgi:hypothetical protein
MAAAINDDHIENNNGPADDVKGKGKGKTGAKKKKSKTDSVSENSPEAKALNELATALTGVRASAAQTLKKLQNTPYEEVRLYKDVVTLRSDLSVSQLLLAAHEAVNGERKAKICIDMNSINSHSTGSSSGDDQDQGYNPLVFGNKGLSTYFFRYRGEVPGAASELRSLSGSFDLPLQMLRQQYHRLDRSYNEDEEILF